MRWILCRGAVQSRGAERWAQCCVTDAASCLSASLRDGLSLLFFFLVIARVSVTRRNGALRTTAQHSVSAEWRSAVLYDACALHSDASHVHRGCELCTAA